MDSEYILSGSDDMNIRVWKSIPHKPIGNVLNYFNIYTIEN
jgi:hypothetical protein